MNDKKAQSSCEDNVNKIRADFNSKAATWDDNPNRIALSSAIVDAVLKTIPITEEMELLDYGAGTGLVTLGLQPYVKSILAADSSEAMLSRLTEKALAGEMTNVKTMLLDLEAKEAFELKFDIIVSSMVMHHIQNVPQLISNLIKMLNPGGYIAVADLDLDKGKFHHDATGVFHNGFDRIEMQNLYISNELANVKITTAFSITKEVKNEKLQDFTIFLMSGQKPMQ